MRAFCLLLILTRVWECTGQPRHYHWYFGFNAGLDFSSGAPVGVNNGALSTDEGVASIADANGQLLFYTNGQNVFNAAHQSMPNGTGLAGSFTTAQSAIIVPFPADPFRYYIFTQAPQAGATASGPGFGGLAYSAVDMALAGGLGDVTVKNTVLTDTTCESLAAAQHPNGKEAWVVTHKWNSDAFFAYRVDCDGVYADPVISNTGRWHSDSTMYNQGAIGCMQFSPDYSRLAIAWSQFSNAVSSKARLDICKFDPATGKVEIAYAIVFDTAATIEERGYGVAFSPNGRFVYASLHGLDNGGAFTRLYQIDLLQSDPDGTKQVVATGFNAFGSLQKAPDGKLYIARLNGAQYLSALAFPDSLGTASQYQQGAVTFAPNYSTWGLPNHWNSYLAPAPVDLVAMKDTVICDNASFTVSSIVPYEDPTYKYSWSTGAMTRAATLSKAGVYTVTAYTSCDTIRDEVVIGNEACPCEPAISNVITPNGDGLNDYLILKAENCTFGQFDLSVFSRWGNRLWRTGDPEEAWRPEAAGTYFYVLTYTLMAGDPVREAGYVTVIR